MARDGCRLFLAVPRGCLRFVIVVFPDHTHLLFLFLILCHDSTGCDEMDDYFAIEADTMIGIVSVT